MTERKHFHPVWRPEEGTEEAGVKYRAKWKGRYLLSTLILAAAVKNLVRTWLQNLKLNGLKLWIKFYILSKKLRHEQSANFSCCLWTNYQKQKVIVSDVIDPFYVLLRLVFECCLCVCHQVYTKLRKLILIWVRDSVEVWAAVELFHFWIKSWYRE